MSKFTGVYLVPQCVGHCEYNELRETVLKWLVQQQLTINEAMQVIKALEVDFMSQKCSGV
ncbi:hypothetical protein AA984_22395 [Brevibacillus formosus]|uniref:Uncharacterized protein n=1 Tax=Brevibacillus formosus TaxID=54913 RepID=A0A837KI43_9BACL|nr:hypothetical protein [Brevibacillus formosus]KLH96762.1 hypothetical protein AA984_22395 [Brevibacillus formosus]MED1955188.1 hypothetical protein [Brevibacillus formosus]PSJ94936.1 hypothetical protein C7R91_16765 [Brevibacillus formosus]GED58434.1 hypothetical protein BFO01nite_25660 [Brevibacillus formosus]